jgi:Tol biopolymer transport system component/tRNA A-37 threonylcarbamoyl transferase component Bud32
MTLISKSSLEAGTAARRWSQVKSVFDSALEIPTLSRSGWLQQACGADESLFEEVEHLLRYHEAASGFLPGGSQDQPSGPTFAEGVVLADRFQVVRLIGVGGMGEVYEVADLTIGEHYALKTIRPEIAANHQLSERFQKELRLSRHISHQNVCRVNELWETTSTDGSPVTFFTMELLRGETLAHRIQTRGPLRGPEAMKIIRQAASGVIEAHRLGIVHCDLKPANIFLADDERAIVMDFGLARTIQVASADDTGRGIIVGTPAYMAPEQFQRGETTIATDVYAFGVTIFEMVTGKNHPLVSPRSLVPELSPAWDSALLRCFEADPAARPASILELTAELELDLQPRRRWLWVWVIIFGGLFGLISLLVPRPWIRSGQIAQTVTAKLTFDPGLTISPAVSADGKTLVYSSDRGKRGNLNIWMQSLDTGELRQLTDEAGHETEPAISPDGKQIAFRSERDATIYIKPASGSPAVALAKWGRNPRFSPDGKRLAFWTGQETEHSTASGSMWIVATSGGAPQRLASEFADARYPEWSSDGKSILFRGARVAYPSLDENLDWWVTDIEGKESFRTGAWDQFRKDGVMPQDTPVVWSGDRVIFSARTGHSTNLWDIPVSQKNFDVTGNAHRLTTGAEFEVTPAVLPDGRILYSNWRVRSNIWSISIRTGELHQVTTGDSSDSKPSISRDGRTLVYGRRLGEAREIWVKEIVSGAERRVIGNAAAVPYVSPDGRSIAYSIKSSVHLWTLASGTDTVLCPDCGELLGWRSGTELLTLRTSVNDHDAIELLQIRGGIHSPLLSDHKFREAAVSPDGNILAFSVREGGVESRIYLARLNKNGTVGSWVPVTPPDSWADKPGWLPDGKSLVYSSERDGFQCLWRQEIDPETLSASGKAGPLKHFHAARLTPFLLSRAAFGLAVSGDFVYVNLAAMEANIWSLEPRAQ